MDEKYEKLKNNLISIASELFRFQRVFVKAIIANPNNYIDSQRYNELKQLGNAALANDDIDQLKQILFELLSIQINSDSGVGMFDNANIVKG